MERQQTLEFSVDDITVIVTIPEYTPAPQEEAPNDFPLERAYENATAWLARHAPSLTDRDDVVQEAVISAWKASDRFIGDEKDFDKWVRVIVHNKLIDDRRKEARPPRIESIEARESYEVMYGDDGSSEYPIVYKDDLYCLVDNRNSFIEEFITTRDAVKAAMKSAITDPGSHVGEKAIQILILHSFFGYSHQEIADHLGIKEVTSKSALSKLRRHLARVALGRTTNGELYQEPPPPPPPPPPEEPPPEPRV